MKKTRLSYSACQRYQRCPQEYKFHYVDRIRSAQLKSSLFFGTAVDKAFETLLITRSLSDAMKTFHREFTFTTDVHGKKVYLPNNLSVSYSPNDIDEELLSDKDREKIEKGEYTVAWACLCKKGYYIVKSLHDNFLPKVKRVIATQKEIEMRNEEGDAFIGLCDAILEMVDGTIIAYDLKTSGIPYERDAVEKSEQLSTYFVVLKERYGINKCGYLVGLKNIRKNREKICSECHFIGTGTKHSTCFNMFGNKRCGGAWEITIDPEAILQDIVGEIPQHFIDITVDNYNQINKGIKNQVFYRNTNSCTRPWGECEFKRACFENDFDGLVKVHGTNK